MIKLGRKCMRDHRRGELSNMLVRRCYYYGLWDRGYRLFFLLCAYEREKSAILYGVVDIINLIRRTCKLMKIKWLQRLKSSIFHPTLFKRKWDKWAIYGQYKHEESQINGLL